MYFILSKILLFLILPIFWILALLVIAVISKDRQRKQKFLIIALIVFYIFSCPLVLNGFQKIWDIRTPPTGKTKKYSCVIVLGGFAGSGGGDEGHFGPAADRFIEGTMLVTTKQASHILISGGNGLLSPGNFREALWAKKQLLKLNLPDSVILTESNSRNTFENAMFSKTVLQKAHLPPPYLVVTSAFHMRRSLMLFKKAGLDVEPYSANYMYGDSSFFVNDLIPDGCTLFMWEIYTKELMGYAINYFK